MTRTIVRHACSAALAATFLAASSMWVQAAAVQVQDLRVGEHPDSTRVVLDISEPTEMTIAVSPDGRTVTIDLPGVEWGARSFAPNRHAKGLVRDFRYGAGRLTLSTNAPVTLKAPFFVGPEGNQGHRAVIDMVADAAAAKPIVAAAAPAPKIPPMTAIAPAIEPPNDVVLVDRMVAGPATIAPVTAPTSQSVGQSIGQSVGQAVTLTPGAPARPVETAQAAPPRAQQPMPPQAPMASTERPRGPLGGLIYAKLGFGVSMLEEATASGSGNDAAVETDLGWLVSGAVGLDLKNNFRLEGEVLYALNEAQSIRGSVNSATVNAGNADGDVSTLAFMANAYYDFVNPYAITPYIFGGVGLANVSLNGVKGAGSTGWDDNAWQFAMQGGLGAALDLTERFSMDLGYRYFETLDPEFSDGNGAPFDYEHAMHLFMLSGRYKF